jgi:hypothetical protein
MPRFRIQGLLFQVPVRPLGVVACVVPIVLYFRACNDDVQETKIREGKFMFAQLDVCPPGWPINEAYDLPSARRAASAVYQAEGKRSELSSIGRGSKILRI